MTNPNCDAADTPQASYVSDPINEIEPLDEETSRAARLIEQFVLILDEARNVKMTLQCMKLTMPSGIGYLEGSSMAEVAAKFGVTKAAISKQCLRLIEELNLPPSRHMRSEQARELARKTNVRRRPNG